MKLRVALVIVSCALACTKPNPKPMPSPPPPPEPTALETLLKDLDPGPQAPVSSIAPEWWFKATEVLTNTPAEVAGVLNKAQPLKLGTSDFNHFENGFRVVAGLTFLERIREAGTCDVVCESGIAHGYYIFAIWSFLDADQAVERSMAGAAGKLPLDRAETLKAFVAQLIREAPQRARAMTVALVRRSPESPEVIGALRDLTAVESRAGNYVMADRISNEVLTKLGAAATSADFESAARIAFRSGNILGGHDHATRAEPLDPDRARQLADMEAWASEAGRLAHATDYEERVRLDELYMKLERHEDVRRLSNELANERPQDARPIFYYGRDTFNSYNLYAAANIMQRAGNEHRTREFYQFALGIGCAVAMSGTLPGVAGDPLAGIRAEALRLRTLNDEYVKVEPSRAEWIAMALDFAQVAMLAPSPDRDEQNRRLRAAVDAMRVRSAEDDAKWPNGDDYAKVRLICAMLDGDQKRARAAIADINEKHPGDAGVESFTRTVLLFRALSWKDNAGLDALLKKLQPSTDRNDRQFVLEVSAIRTDVKNVAAWQALAEAYQSIGAPENEAEKRRYANNLAVMRFRSNRQQEAHDLWFASGSAGTEFPAALLNLYATESTERDTLWQALEYRLGVENHLDHVAKAWTIRFTSKDKAAEKKALEELTKNEPKPVFGPPTATATPNVALEKNLKVDIGFANDTLTTDASLEAVPWLLVEP